MLAKIIGFKSAEQWGAWLSKNHSKSSGIWMRRYKKDSHRPSVTGSDALDIALCYGWITGQAKPYDKISILWYFCPRRPRSLWSKINTVHAERLIRAGRMKPGGMKEIEEAKADGRWERAYEPQKTATLPPDFLEKINKNKKAKAFLKTLNRSNVYAIIFRLHTIRDGKRRMEKTDSIIAMLARGEEFH